MGEWMTRLADFVGTRSMAELYDTYWVPGVLDVFGAELASRFELLLRGNYIAADGVEDRRFQGSLRRISVQSGSPWRQSSVAGRFPSS